MMKIKYIILIVLSVLLIGACDKAPKTWQESVQKAIAENRTLTKDDFKLLFMEDYTDPKQFDGPRIMFKGPVPWPMDYNSHSDTLWSIKPDGTGLRMILTLEEMYGDTRGCCINKNTDLARSRDNRYIAFVTGYKDIPESPDTRGLWMVDMKTREFIEVHRRQAVDLNFTYQGDKLTYISYGRLYEYDIATRETTKRSQPIQGSSGFTLQGPQNNIIMHRGTKIYFFTFEGKPIRTIDLKTLLPNWTDDDFRYSSDGSLYSANGRYVVIPFLSKRNTIVDLSEKPIATLIQNCRALPNGNGFLASNGIYYESVGNATTEVFPKYRGNAITYPGEIIPKELVGGYPVLYIGTGIFINEKY